MSTVSDNASPSTMKTPLGWTWLFWLWPDLRDCQDVLGVHLLFRLQKDDGYSAGFCWKERVCECIDKWSRFYIHNVLFKIIYTMLYSRKYDRERQSLTITIWDTTRLLQKPEGLWRHPIKFSQDLVWSPQMHPQYFEKMGNPGAFWKEYLWYTPNALLGLKLMCKVLRLRPGSGS